MGTVDMCFLIVFLEIYFLVSLKLNGENFHNDQDKTLDFTATGEYKCYKLYTILGNIC